MGETMLYRATLAVAAERQYSGHNDASIARAVIASLREPSEAVTDAIDDVVTGSTHGYAMADLWRSMSDFLQEPKT